MRIEKSGRFVEFIKKYAMYLVVGVVIFMVAMTFTIVAATSGSVPANTSVLEFRLPMTNATIVKDFSNTELQNNETLNQWEAHLAVDFSAESADVFSVLDGRVMTIDYSYLDGYTVAIQHDGGFVSIYSSLQENVAVKVGDSVSAGQKIGAVGDSASGELELGPHLHFTMKLNDKFVDPNDYLDLQQK